MRSWRWLLPMCAILGGCAKKRDPAPTELQDLVGFLFLSWDDPEALPEGIDNLGDWLRANVDTDEAQDGFALQPLSAADVANVEHPDADLSELLGACAAARSAFRVEDHATYIPLEDQTFSNPTQYKAYSRDIVGGTAKSFEHDEQTLKTVNDIETSSLGVTIPYTLKKDYEWVDTEQEHVVFARSWIEDRSCNKDGDGGNCLEQSYSIDLFYADGTDDASMRFTASWSQVDTSISLPDATLVASLAIGIQNVFYATEKFLEDGGTAGSG